MTLPIQRALLSVTDKTNLLDLCRFLKKCNPQIQLLATSGTFKAIDAAGIAACEVSNYTKFPEILDGRVKSLHPKVHGGILARRDMKAHMTSMEELDFPCIDLIVVNLYAFEKAAAEQDSKLENCVETIDIGGPALLRSAAKNFAHVVCLSSPDQYSTFYEEMVKAPEGSTSLEFRKTCATAAFLRTSSYDMSIHNYIKSTCNDTSNELAKSESCSTPDWRTTLFKNQLEVMMNLKYGMNPHQQPAILITRGGQTPITVLNGTPGYVNMLDAISAWELVMELSQQLKEESGTGKLPAVAASFKHVSPAGVGVGLQPLTDDEEDLYGLRESKTALFTDVVESRTVLAAVVRARNSDPLCSFGDFLAVQGHVDGVTARYLKQEVSDGIIGASFSSEAVQILSKKKKGKYVILKGDVCYIPPPYEYREAYGIGLIQKRNTCNPLGDKIKVNSTVMNCPSSEDMTAMKVAAFTVKFTQSNSICFAVGNQVVAVAAGQQSRVDAVKICQKKSEVWKLRRHPRVRELNFLQGLKTQDRTNARVEFIDASLNSLQLHDWEKKFQEKPEPLSREEVAEWLGHKNFGICAVSDGFFPFTDSIDIMAQALIQWVVHPGGSIADEAVAKQADKHAIGLVCTALVENVRAADAWNAHFQKLPFLKLVLRLATDIIDQNERSKKQLLELGAERPATTSAKKAAAVESRSTEKSSSPTFPLELQTAHLNDTAGQENKSGESHDTLYYCRAQIEHLLSSLGTDPSRALPNGRPLVLKFHTPAISRELDKVVTILAAVAKVHVASIVSDSIATMRTQSGGKTPISTGTRIEPRNVYDALRKTT